MPRRSKHARRRDRARDRARALAARDAQIMFWWRQVRGRYAVDVAPLARAGADLAAGLRRIGATLAAALERDHWRQWRGR